MSSRERLVSERRRYFGASSARLARSLTSEITSCLVGDERWTNEGVMADASGTKSNHSHVESRSRMPEPARPSLSTSFWSPDGDGAANTRSPAMTMTGKRGFRNAYRIGIVFRRPTALQFTGPNRGAMNDRRPFPSRNPDESHCLAALLERQRRHLRRAALERNRCRLLHDRLERVWSASRIRRTRLPETSPQR